LTFCISVTVSATSIRPGPALRPHRGYDLLLRDPPVGHGVGDLVEDEQLVVAAAELVPGHLEGVAAFGLCLVEVGRLPREPVAEGVPLDAEMVGQLALARLPLATLDELDDPDPPAPGPPPGHHPEGGRGLPLAMPGVEEDDGVGAGHARGG
jgi:hypothetical protein